MEKLTKKQLDEIEYSAGLLANWATETFDSSNQWTFIVEAVLEAVKKEREKGE